MIRSVIPTRSVGGTGILSINAIEDQVQTLGVTTTGLDIGVTSLATGLHTIVLPATGVSAVAGTVGLSLFGYWNDKISTVGATTTGLAMGMTMVSNKAVLIMPAIGGSVSAGTIGLSLYGYWNAKDDKPTTGTGATGVAPGYLGALYLDTSALTLFVGVTTAAGASSWVALN